MGALAAEAHVRPRAGWLRDVYSSLESFSGWLAADERKCVCQVATGCGVCVACACNGAKLVLDIQFSQSVDEEIERRHAAQTHLRHRSQGR